MPGGGPFHYEYEGERQRPQTGRPKRDRRANRTARAARRRNRK